MMVTLTKLRLMRVPLQGRKPRTSRPHVAPRSTLRLLVEHRLLKSRSASANVSSVSATLPLKSETGGTELKQSGRMPPTGSVEFERTNA